MKRMRTACHSLGTCPAGEIRGGHRSPEAPLSSAHAPREERTQAMEDADRGNPCPGHGACREKQERRWGRGRHRLLPPPPRQETGLSPHPRDGHPHDSPKTLGTPNAAGTMLHSEKPQPKTLPPPPTPDVIQKKSPKKKTTCGVVIIERGAMVSLETQFFGLCFQVFLFRVLSKGFEFVRILEDEQDSWKHFGDHWRDSLGGDSPFE